MKHTDKNIEKLARAVVDSWDMDTLLCTAHDRLVEDYKKDKELFDEDVKTMFKD